MSEHACHRASQPVAILATVAATLLAPGIATAQAAAPDTNERLLECDALQDPAAKLACFNAVVQGLKSEPGAPDTVPAPDPAPAAEIAPAAAATPPATEPAASAPAPAKAAEPRPAAAIDVTPAPRAEPAPVDATPTRRSDPPAEPAPVAGLGADDFGLDSMRRRDNDLDDQDPAVESIRARITQVWRTNDGRFAVRLDNGQIWRETQGTRIGMPDEGRTVEISHGRLGGYRMKVDNITRIAWVRRYK